VLFIAVISVSDLRELHLGRSAYLFFYFVIAYFWNVPIPRMIVENLIFDIVLKSTTFYSSIIM